MADAVPWFKLWTTAISDPNLSELALEDFARWALLGLYIRAHGKAGTVTVHAPARALCHALRLTDLEAVRALCFRLPHITYKNGDVSPETPSETSVTVSMDNWAKYQGDLSTPRVRKHREQKRLNETHRGEERRREEKRREESSSPSPQKDSPKSPPVQSPPAGFEAFWAAYPSKVGIDDARRAWLKRHPSAELRAKILAAIEAQRTWPKWQEGIIPNPATWLNQGRWEDQPPQTTRLTPKTAGNVDAARRFAARTEDPR